MPAAITHFLHSQRVLAGTKQAGRETFSPEAFAWGALAWNFSAWIIMPLYGISMQGIEYEIPSIGVFSPAI